ncbi:MAG TPA: class I SAM-dependent methyltransferase [Rhizomicrobium sp.]
MTLTLKHHGVMPSRCNDGEKAIAAAYNQAGANYAAYADGDVRKLFAFDGQYSYGDRKIWAAIEQKLRMARATNNREIRILDLGCGPGTWLRRVVWRAHQFGFERIVAQGIDIADAQVLRARKLGGELAQLRGVDLRYDVGDLQAGLAGVSRVDLSLCLCGVLNHVSPKAFPDVLKSIAGVTSDCFIATVRTIGSPPTIYVDKMEAALDFHQDNERNKLEIDLRDGHHISFDSHLFNKTELGDLAEKYFHIEDLRGLDLFHGRFADDPRWNPPATANKHFQRELDRLEEQYCRDPKFIDHAAHLLLVAKPRTFV